MSETSPEALSRAVFWLLVVGAVGFVLAIALTMAVMPATTGENEAPAAVSTGR